MGSVSKHAEYLDSLNRELQLSEFRYKAADLNEDSHYAAMESGFIASMKKSIELFRSIVLEVTDNE